MQAAGKFMACAAQVISVELAIMDDDFPTELLVYIFSFLHSVRDKLTLFYVSKRIRSVIEVPSLWREPFVWPYYESREEFCVNNLLKTCGRYVKTLSFPDHAPPLQTFVRNCHNVVELSLPKSKLDREQIGKVIRYMQQLQKLDVEWSFGLMRLLVISNQIKELTIRWCEQIKYPGNSRKFTISVNLFLFLLTGKNLKLKPQNINLVGIDLCRLVETKLSKVWPNWNISLSNGHIIHVKVYERLKTPLDLFPALPGFQFRFGHLCHCKLVELDLVAEIRSEIPNRGYDIPQCYMLLTDRIVGNNTAALKASLHYSYSYHYAIMKCNISCLNLVTDIDLSFCDLLNSDHLTLISKTCPNLNRLDLYEDDSCLKNLKGLRSIASCCRNLQGLNLVGIHVTQVENHIELWEILSDMKLTHLAIEQCNVMPPEYDDTNKTTLIKLYQKCSQLQALCLKNSAQNRTLCPNHCELDTHRILLLSNFPSLAFCNFKFNKHTSTAVHDILTSCKKISCFCFLPGPCPVPLSFPSELTVCNLQQLFIRLRTAVIPDIFMNAVSAHGKLVHVILIVHSVSYEGMTALILNSPELSTFRTATMVNCITSNMKADLKKRFAYRRLFNCGSFVVREIQKTYTYEFHAVLQVTSYLFSLFA